MFPLGTAAATTGVARVDARARVRDQAASASASASAFASAFACAPAFTFAFAATLLALVASAPVAAAQPAAAPREIRAHFSCSGDKAIDATFINADPASVRLVLSDGRALTLPQTLSASGARYANGDESIVFWNKGDTAFVEEGGRTTYAGCVTSR
jgi:membrane-bound inhibitor of C-type lysozyme